jgi:hypothetical protein
LIFKYYLLLYKTNYLDVEVHCIEPSPTVSVPCMDEGANGQADDQMDGKIKDGADGWTDGQMDRWTDGQMDR